MNRWPAAVTADWAAFPADQQPQWRYHPEYVCARESLAALPPLVRISELWTLRGSIARVAHGDAQLLQAGDCAEHLDEVSRTDVMAKTSVLTALADRLRSRTGTPVVRVGRMGGQFAKPRSRPTEFCGEREIPVFRGHMINSEVSLPSARRHNPRRMLWSYQASARVLDCLRERSGRLDDPYGPWVSHEALVMDYEGVSVHADPGTGRVFLGSTHLPWVGERTRQPDGAQVRLLSTVCNPVACKVGPRARIVDILRVCALLDAEREPGRLTLIVRMGRAHVAEALPPLITAVRRAGHPVVWLSDPMHGNTRLTSTGMKTRYLAEVAAEAVEFRRVLERHRLHPGGLHLEVATSNVTECVGGPVEDERIVSSRYTTLCDPRLNPEQAFQLVEAWC